MNIEQANAIDLSAILKSIGMMPQKQQGVQLWYVSPFRNEKTASLHVNASKNIWYDFGQGKGGNAVDFVCEYLASHNEDHTVQDALRWMKNMQPNLPLLEMLSKEEPPNYGATLELRKAVVLQNSSLIDYLNARGIPLTYAKKYLKEVHVRNANTQKIFYAIGMQNEDGGYELRNKFFKGCIAPKCISFIRGKKTLPDEIHIFEGFMDFLSALVYQKTNRFEGDVIILNSVSNLSRAFPYIKNYGYKILYTWLDNDEAGDKATKALNKFVADERIAHKAMNPIYAPHKDVNAWHIRKLDL